MRRDDVRTVSKPSPLEVGLQVSRRVCAQAAAESDFWVDPPAIGNVFHSLAQQKECQILEGHLMPDHVHICLTIPPKHPVASVIGFLKGKSAIAVARQFGGRKRNFNGESFWARGYAVSTVGFETVKIKEYIQNQEQLDRTSGAGENGSF